MILTLIVKVWGYDIVFSPEIGFQISSLSIMCSLHMLINWSISGNQSAKAQTSNSGWSWRSLEKDISHVFCILYQHSVGKCQLTLHPSFVYADYKVIHTGNHRWDLEIISLIIIFLHLIDVAHDCVSSSHLFSVHFDSCFAVASLEKVLWLANLGLFGSYCWRNSAHFYYRT